MILNDDIISTISKELCIFDFANIHNYYTINKTFYKFLKEFLTFLKNYSSSIILVSQIRHWRPELDYPEILFNNFMICDDFNAFKLCISNSKEYHNSMEGLQNNVILCELSKEYHDIDLLDFIIEPSMLREQSYIDSYNYIIDNISDKHIDTKFDTFFIYYFTNYYISMNSNAGYEDGSLSFCVLPYFNELFTKRKNFHSFHRIKKNYLMNHNITGIGNISFINGKF